LQGKKNQLKKKLDFKKEIYLINIRDILPLSLSLLMTK